MRTELIYLKKKCCRIKSSEMPILNKYFHATNDSLLLKNVFAILPLFAIELRLFSNCLAPTCKKM